MKAAFLAGNRIELLRNGGQYFPALLAAIDGARQEIHLESYIFADDEIGRTVALALGKAARRGVATRVMVDGFGAPDFMSRLGQGMIAQGVEVMVYRPEVTRLRLSRHRLRRMHRKLAVIDRGLAFVGGINVIDDLDTPDQAAPRFDYAVAVEGPLVDPVHATVRHLWRLLRWASFRRRPPEMSRPLPANGPCGSVEAAFVVRDNLRHRRDIEEAYLDAIGAARSEIILANAYFLPGRRFRHALTDAVARGVRVSVLLQGRVEYLLQHYATQALYGSLLGAGVKIFEYRPSFLHAKVAVIDGEWATVGSSNIDPFSLLLAREANVIVRDAGFAGQLRRSLAQAIADDSSEVRAADFRVRPILQRAASWLAYTAVRLAVGLAGYGGKREYRA